MTLYSNYIKQGRRNALFNGNFDNWTAGAGPFTSGDTAIMMAYGDTGPVVCEVTRSTASKPNNTSQYVYKIEVTTADTSITDAEYVHTMYRLEGHDFFPFVGQTATFSFWVRSSVAGIYSCFFRSGGVDRSYISEFTINAADTWEKKKITLKFDYSGGTWDYTTGLGLSIGFAPACGTTYATSSTGQWITGNYIASSNQISNWASTVGNTFQLAQMQLELGSNASPFERLPIATIEEAALRYYSSTYLYENAIQVNYTTGRGYTAWDFPAIMRVAPTVTHPGIAQMWNGTWVAASNVTHSANEYRCVTVVYTTSSGYTVRNSQLILINPIVCDARV